MQVSSGLPHMLTLNQRGRGKEPVVVLGRIKSFVTVNIAPASREPTAATTPVILRRQPTAGKPRVVREGWGHQGLFLRQLGSDARCTKAADYARAACGVASSTPFVAHNLARTCRQANRAVLRCFGDALLGEKPAPGDRSNHHECSTLPPVAALALGGSCLQFGPHGRYRQSITRTRNRQHAANSSHFLVRPPLVVDHEDENVFCPSRPASASAPPCGRSATSRKSRPRQCVA